jgi:hypothetical protein
VLGAVAIAIAAVASPLAAQADRPQDILALRQMLEQHRWATLDSALAARAAEARADNAREARYVFAFDAFARADSVLRPHLDAWIAQEPYAAVPRAARAVYFRAMAVAAARHGSTEAERSESEHDIRRWTRLAQDDARAARRRDSTDVMGYAAVLDLCEVKQEHFDAVIREWPGTLLLRARHLRALGPRCFGTLDSMTQEVVAQRLARPDDERLRVLEALPEFHMTYARADSTRHAATLEAYTTALSYGDFWEIRFARAVELLRVSELEAALVDLDRVIDERPGYAAALAWRAGTLKELAKRKGGAAGARLYLRSWEDMRLAAELNVEDPHVAFVLGEKNLEHTADSMP